MNAALATPATAAAGASAATQPGTIGVYDSGVGGLSVLRTVQRLLPDEDCLYVADSGHAPYGGRSGDFLLARARHVTAHLVAQGARAVLLACNTVSVATAATLRREFGLPIVAMEPAIKPAAAATRSGQVLVLATEATVRSAAVQRLCALHGQGLRIHLQACPGLVEQVEQGAFDAPATRTLLQRYLGPALQAGADTVVLGCTHYPFLARQMRDIAGPAVALLEPSEAVVRQLARRLGRAVAAPPAPATPRPTGRLRCHTSGSVAALQRFLNQVGLQAEAVRALA